MPTVFEKGFFIECVKVVGKDITVECLAEGWDYSAGNFYSYMIHRDKTGEAFVFSGAFSRAAVDM